MQGNYLLEEINHNYQMPIGQIIQRHLQIEILPGGAWAILQTAI